MLPRDTILPRLAPIELQTPMPHPTTNKKRAHIRLRELLCSPSSVWDPRKPAQRGNELPQGSPLGPCCFPGSFHCLLLTNLFGASLVLTEEH